MITWEVNQEAGKKIEKDFFKDIVKTAFYFLEIKEASLSIAIIGSSEIREANKNYRGKDEVTDVLSFIYEKTPLEGEILICYEKVLSQAKKMKHSFEEELRVLLVHSLVHLAGYDHKENKGAKKMNKMEGLILEAVKKSL